MTNKIKITDKRSFYKPFKYPWAYDYFKKSEQMHWLPAEVPMQLDVQDWKRKLTPEQKALIVNIFRFFTQGDIDVSEGYVNNYLPHFPAPEVRQMLLSFAARESIHIDAYSHLIETLGMPDSIYKEFLDYKVMLEKHQFVEDISKDSSPESIALNIAVFSGFTEGMQLFSSFIMLLDFTRRGLMKGMGQIITWSIADESLHVEAMIKLFRTYISENKELWTDELKSKIYKIAEKMVELEDNFIDLCFNGISPNNEDLKPEEVKQYIRYIADRRLIALGMKGVFKVKKNPLKWVEEILGAPGHTNFFENKPSDYAKASLTGSWDSVFPEA